MTMKKLLFLSILVLLVSCQKNEPNDVFGKTPSERFEQSQSELRAALTAPQQGWKLAYATNKEKFGTFNVLMKFSAEGTVTMTSDIGGSYTPTNSQYTIQEAQGTLLVFSTYNHIHKLGDPQNPSDLNGKGLEGEFQFIYYGKEGDKLKFRTQRKETEQFVYFEPATANDWANVETWGENINLIEDNADNYFFTVSNTATSTGYEMSFSHRFLTLKSITGNETVKANVVPTDNGIAFEPALSLLGKNFTGLVRDNSTNPPTYKATVEGTTAKLSYSLVPPQELINDDYKHINTSISGLVIVPNPMVNHPLMSDSFKELLELGGGKTFAIFRLDFEDDGTCSIQVGYKFDGDSRNSWIYLDCNYELNNKRLYLNNPTPLNVQNSWRRTQNAAILAKGRALIQKILDLGAGGFYVKSSGSYSGYKLYRLQSFSAPEYIAPFLGIDK